VHLIMHFLLHTSPLLIYLLVAVILTLESSGVPITNNTMLLVTGALASLGHLNIGILAIAAILGSITGACLAYFIGAQGGRRVLLRLAAFFHVDTQKMGVMDRWFQKSGVWMIFLSRMTPFVRPFACFPAGISQMNFVKFFIAASTGSVIWCIALLAIGWRLGRHWTFALYLMKQYTLPTIGVLILLVGLYFVGMRLIKRSLKAKYSSSTVH